MGKEGLLGGGGVPPYMCRPIGYGFRASQTWHRVWTISVFSLVEGKVFGDMAAHSYPKNARVTMVYTMLGQERTIHWG